MKPVIRGAALLASLLSAACLHEPDPHDHTDEHPEGHDHHEEGHGHDGAVVGITAWSDRFELFAEHTVGVVGHPIDVLVHLTVLEGFAALEFGTVALEFEGPGALGGTSKAALRPGIYRISMTPEAAGTYRGRVRIDGPVSGTIEGIALTVYSDHAAAAAAAPKDDDDGALIEFLKEQQWKVPFGTAFSAQGALTPAIEVSGRVQTPPDGRAEVGAPVAGRIVAPRGGLARPWTSVKKGQLLASLSPTPSSPEASARASLVVAEAEARAAAARAALSRAERLLADQAIPQRALEDARREATVAAEAVAAARRAAQLYAGASASSGRGTWRLVAPISGVLSSVQTQPGASVTPGQALFRIVDPEELWITARVPEQEAARLRTDGVAHVRVAGVEGWTPVRSTPAGVVVGRTVEEVSRTVEVIYPLRDPDPRLRIGGLVTVSLPVGEDFSGVVVPRSALIDFAGRAVVYVQVDGEHFEERSVRVGPRVADRVGVVRGLAAGERVVVEGAHLVRLAETAKGAPAHGHVH